MVTDIKKKLIYAECLDNMEKNILFTIKSKEIELKETNKLFAKATNEDKESYSNKTDEIIQTIKCYKSILNYLANMSI